MKTIDKSILKLFKENSTAKASNSTAKKNDSLIKRSVETICSGPVSSAVQFLLIQIGQQSNHPDESRTIESLKILVLNRLLATAEFVYLQILPQIGHKELHEIMPIMATPLCVSKWIALRNPEAGSKGDSRESIAFQMAQRAPEAAARCALARWIVETGTNAHPLIVSAFFGLAEQHDWTYRKSELLYAALKADQSGSFLIRMLQNDLLSDSLRHEWISAINNDSLLDEVLRAIPKAAAIDKAGLVAIFVETMFNKLPHSNGNIRRKMCSRLLSLASALMSKPRSFGVDRCLVALDAVSQMLRNVIANDEIDADAGGFRYFGYTSLTQQTAVSPDGAKLVTIAMNRMREGVDPVMMLEATAENLGMTSIGVIGEIAAFDPIQHQDLTGGVRPGENVVFTQKGWMIGRQVINRAQVKALRI
jgi:hypothetical protein